MPRGTSWLARFSIISMAWPELTPGAGLPFIAAAGYMLERLEDIVHRSAVGFRPGPIDVQIEPGCIGSKAGVQVAQVISARPSLEDGVGLILEGRQAAVAAIFQHDLETARRAQPLNLRR